MRRLDLAKRAAANDPGSLPGGDETVLLVDDEDGVRELVKDILELAGYRVLVASRPDLADRISEEFPDPIDLLLTDVVMPEMNGRELAERVQSRRPGIRVLYMSGYPAQTVLAGGVLPSGIHFISKPFTRTTLLHRVRQALDAGSGTVTF